MIFADADSAPCPADSGSALSWRRLFAQESPVVLLDEPTVGLDADSRDRVARQIVRLAASGRTIVAATHDVGLAGRFDFCVLLGAGSVLATGSPEAIFTEPNLAAALSLG